MYLLLFVGVLCLYSFWYALLYVLSNLDEEEKVGCFAFIVFRVSCYCKCHVALHNGAVGLSANCDCGIS